MIATRIGRSGLAFALAGAIAAIGCTTATPYQPEVSGHQIAGGYSEALVGEARYRVNFSGNSLTSRDRVEGYLLYRAAELTVRDGYDWFLIIDRLTERDVQTYVHPDPLYDPYYGRFYHYWRPHWRYYQGGAWNDWHPEWGGPFWADRPEMQSVERFEAHAEIVMRRGPVPAGEERAFDARQVMARLGPSIERPSPRQP